MARKLHVTVALDGGPSQISNRIVEAPADDIAAAINRGLIAFDEVFNLELEWIRQRSAEEAEEFCRPDAA